MAKVNKLNGCDRHAENLEKVQETIKYLLESCDSDMTPYRKSKFVLAKLKELLPLFEEKSSMESIRISVCGFIQRLSAIEKGYFDQPNADKKEEPIEGKPIEEVVAQNKAIYVLLSEITETLNNVDEILSTSTASLDAYDIVDVLNSPEGFNSPDTQEMLKKYPKRTRTRLKELGMNAFMIGSKIPEKDIQNVLEGNA